MIAIRAEIRAIEEGRLDRTDNPLKHAPHPASVVTADAVDTRYSVRRRPTRTARSWKRSTGRRSRASTMSMAIAISFAVAFPVTAADASEEPALRATPNVLAMRILVLGGGVVGVPPRGISPTTAMK
jgi:hypothetical protein